MPIIGLQRQQAQQGRVRIGTTVQGVTREGKEYTRPSKLTTFRFTSPARHLIGAVADLLGGEPQPWAGPNAQPGQWEVITEADRMNITIPPGQDIDPWMEMWRRGMCVRRCDRQTEQLLKVPCQCPADDVQRQADAARGRACKPTTRVSFMIQDLPGLGTWLYESHGYYAAAELPGVGEMIRTAGASGLLIPAQARIDQRSRAIYRGEGEQAEQRDYSVLVIDVLASARQITDAATSGARIAGELPPPMTPKKAIAAGPAGARAIEQSVQAGQAAEGRAQELADEVVNTTDSGWLRGIWQSAQAAGVLDEFVRVPHYDELISLSDVIRDQKNAIEKGAVAGHA
jgi:hypothetical protein